VLQDLLFLVLLPQVLQNLMHPHEAVQNALVIVLVLTNSDCFQDAVEGLISLTQARMDSCEIEGREMDFQPLLAFTSKGLEIVIEIAVAHGDCLLVPLAQSCIYRPNSFRCELKY